MKKIRLLGALCIFVIGGAATIAQGAVIVNFEAIYITKTDLFIASDGIGIDRIIDTTFEPFTTTITFRFDEMTENVLGPLDTGTSVVSETTYHGTYEPTPLTSTFKSLNDVGPLDYERKQFLVSNAISTTDGGSRHSTGSVDNEHVSETVADISSFYNYLLGIEYIERGLYSSIDDIVPVYLDDVLSLLMGYQAAGTIFDLIESGNSGDSVISSGQRLNLAGSKYEGTAIISSVTVVPVPAAVWLFGSGLLGLVSVARRKKSAWSNNE